MDTRECYNTYNLSIPQQQDKIRTKTLRTKTRQRARTGQRQDKTRQQTPEKRTRQEKAGKDNIYMQKINDKIEKTQQYKEEQGKIQDKDKKQGSLKRELIQPRKKENTIRKDKNNIII